MDKIKVLKLTKPVEGENTHIQAHEEINKTISQFHSHINNIVDSYNNINKMYQDAYDKLTASFSEIKTIKKQIENLSKEIRDVSKDLEELKIKFNEGRKFLTVRYEGILDTDTQVVADLDKIPDEDLKGRSYLANIVVHEAIPNQGTMTYSFPQTSLVFGEYTPHVYLMAKEGEHAVLEYDFTVILTEI